ncbi:hypothetical protein VXS06_14565 [Photobacterium toruni]|uniref:Uncharacterized protein n=1 Tax=Photobacterium toruni TaxID=1935446 RepID=A0ABU6L8S7_9GAMM|nr:hypothetical protein [Photobacterium toruni]
MRLLSKKELNIRLIKAYPLLRLNNNQIPDVDFVMVNDLINSFKFSFTNWQDIMPIAHQLGIYARPVGTGYYAQDRNITVCTKQDDVHTALVVCCIKLLESGTCDV